MPRTILIYWIKLCVILLLCTNNVQAFYIPCTCNPAMPMAYELNFANVRDSMTDSVRKMCESEVIQQARDCLEALRVMQSIYRDVNQIRNNIGYVSDMFQNFSLGSIQNSWSIESFDDLNQISNSIRSATGNPFDAYPRNNENKTSVSGISGFLKSLNDSLKETETNSRETSRYFSDDLYYVQSVNTDRLMYGVVLSSAKATELKKSAAAISQNAPASVMAECNVKESPKSTVIGTISEKVNAQAARQASWDNMVNSWILSGEQKLKTNMLELEQTKEDLSKSCLKILD